MFSACYSFQNCLLENIECAEEFDTKMDKTVYELDVLTDEEIVEEVVN